MKENGMMKKTKIICTLGPSSETPEKPVGTFFFSIYYNGKVHDFRFYAEGAPEEKLHKVLNQACRELNQLIQPE